MCWHVADTTIAIMGWRLHCDNVVGDGNILIVILNGFKSCTVISVERGGAIKL